jgi:hypothetical protein
MRVNEQWHKLPPLQLPLWQVPELLLQLLLVPQFQLRLQLRFEALKKPKNLLKQPLADLASMTEYAQLEISRSVASSSDLLPLLQLLQLCLLK